MEIKHGESQLLLIYLSAPNYDTPSFFMKVFQEADSLANDLKIIGGDFNLVLNKIIDKAGGRDCTNDKSSEFVKEYMEIEGLVDIWRYKNKNTKFYTWRRSNPMLIQCQLHFFLISQALIQLTASVGIIPGVLSDHSIISLNFYAKENKKGSSYWKLNTSILEEEEYGNIIHNIIDQEQAEHYVDWQWRIQDFP